MSTLHSSLYAVALASFALLLFGVGWQIKRERRRGAGQLFTLLLLLTLNFALEWLMSNPSTPAKALWLTLVMAVALLLGPCLWIYARTVTGAEPPRLRQLSRVHGLPIVAGLVLLLPLLATTHLGGDFAKPGPAVQPVIPIHATMLAAILIFALQTAFYLRVSVRILARHTAAAKVLLSDCADRELDALRLLIFVVGTHWIVGIARTLHCLILGKDAGWIVLFAVSEVMITVWAAVTLMRGRSLVSADDRQLAENLGAAKYARSALDAPTRMRIGRKLDEALNDQHLHRDSRLTLRTLCAQIRENSHYVSQVINQDRGTSFYDLVNRQRIRDAMSQLATCPDKPVLQIALEVGFNSKSTFNAAFRQHAEMTPSEFRAQQPRGNAPS